MSHRQVKILTGSRQRRDQVPIIIVSSGWTDADNQSDVHVCMLIANSWKAGALNRSAGAKRHSPAIEDDQALVAPKGPNDEGYRSCRHGNVYRHATVALARDVR